MADSIDDILVTSEDWVDVFALSGIAVGSALVINNKSSIVITTQIKATKPDSDDENGPEIQPFSYLQLDAGASGFFAKSESMIATINVQEG